MNIEIAKRGSSTVNISLNSRGGRSLNIPKTQGEKINLPPPTKPHVEKRDANKETSNPKSVIISINKKPNQEKTEKQDQSLNISFKQPESTINTKETPEIQYTTLPSCKTENKDQQKEYIKSVQQFIDQILNDSPQINIGIKLQNKIDSLQKMIQTIMTYDDKILNESKIIIMIINLFLDDSIYKANQYNDFHKIFFDNDNNFIIGNKLNQYFIYNDKNSIESIIKFTKKIFNIKLGNKQQIIKRFYNIKQKSTTFSKETSNILDDAIDEFENDFQNA